MNMHIGEAIDDISKEARRYEEAVHYYGGEYLTRFARKIENNLYDARIRTNSNAAYEMANHLKRIIQKIETMVKDVLDKNRMIFMKMAEGEPIDNIAIMHELESLRNQVQNIILTQLDPTQLKYDLINELRLNEHEQAKYEIGRILTNDLSELQNEMMNESARTIDRTIQTNMAIHNMSKKEEIIIVELSPEKKFTIEKQGNRSRVREYNAKDEFECKEKYVGPAAQNIYQNILSKSSPEERKVIENIVNGPENIEIIIVELSPDKKFVIENAGEISRVRPYTLNDEFEYKEKYIAPEAQNIYSHIMQVAPIEVQQELQMILSEKKEQLQIMIITTSDNQMYTIERMGENMSLRPYQQTDEFVCTTRFFGKDADMLYAQLNINQKMEQQVETLPNNVIK